jgi:transposase
LPFGPLGPQDRARFPRLRPGDPTATATVAKEGVMRYVGLDLHKWTVEACALDPDGKVAFRRSVACDRVALEAFARSKQQADDRVAVEATTSTWAVADLLRPFVAAVVGNPLRIKAITRAKVKTDAIDARVLAHLLRCDFLPAVWHPDPATQRLRQVSTDRANLVTDRTRLKNRLTSALAQRLIVPPVERLFTQAGLAWLRAADLPADVRATVDAYLRLFDAVERELAGVDAVLMAAAHRDERARLLMTLPGVAHGVAVAVLTALGDIARFRDGDHAASYLGLVPVTRQSGGRCHHGRITKAGSGHTRAMLVQAAQHAAAHPGPVGAFFRRLAKRKTRNVAVVATDRKLVTVAYLMLKHNEPYRYAKPETVRMKLGQVRRAAGEKPTRSADASEGRLNTVYARAGLPTAKRPDELPAGERRTLTDAGASAFAEEVHAERPWKGRSRREPDPTD